MKNNEIIHAWDPQLSDHEVHFIGMISIQWASLEFEIFEQTLSTFPAEQVAASLLPKEMNNIQFTGVLALWKDRVADKTKGRRGKILQQQYDEICRLKEVRDALVHGMWHWSARDLGQISTIRLKKREVITAEFSLEVLGDIAQKLGQINFKLRYPGGTVDIARARMSEGGYISRRAMAMFTGAPIDDQGYPNGIEGR